MDQYHQAAATGTCNRLPQEMQDLHNDIAQQENLPDLAKLVLLMDTFVPYGRYTTYNAMREWIHEVRHKCPDSHIASALRKGASRFSLDDIPVHRIVERNGGVSNFNGRACAWGDHLPESDVDTREALWKEDGGRLDKNGTILGGRLELQEVEEEMKGTMVKKYINNFPYRFGGWD